MDDREEAPEGLFSTTDRLVERDRRERHLRAQPSTHELGNAAEDRAVEHLVGMGLVIVERNYRCRLGEIDVVARDGSTLVFVEVRSRESARYGSALDAVTRAKRRQVSRVAAVYLRHKRPRSRRFRFDVVAITGDDLVYVRDAWRLGLLAA